MQARQVPLRHELGRRMSACLADWTSDWFDGVTKRQSEGLMMTGKFSTPDMDSLY